VAATFAFSVSSFLAMNTMAFAPVAFSTMRAGWGFKPSCAIIVPSSM